MNKIGIAVLAIILLAARGFCAEQEQAPNIFGGTVRGAVSLSAVVEAVDPAARTVTLKNEGGTEVTVVCGPEVRNFAQIQKGDTVNIDYSEKVKILVSDAPAIPEKQKSLEISRAPLGQKPAGVVTGELRILATVEAIDYAKRIVTLKGPQRTLEVQVAGDNPMFEKMKAGDSLYVDYMERTAISVTK